MISITLLSLPPETLRRMASHDAATETGCRRWERVGAFVLALLAGAIAVTITLLTL